MNASHQLSTAHKLMTPDEIAAHALNLAAYLEAYAELVPKLVSHIRDLEALIDDHVAAREGAQQIIYKCNEMNRSGREATGRDLIAAAAAVSIPPLPVSKIEAPELYDVTFAFNPVPRSAMQ